MLMRQLSRVAFGLLIGAASLLYGGAVNRITKHVFDDKTVIILHDTHVMSPESTFQVNGRTYTTKSVAESQKKVWHDFFANDINNIPLTKSLYLEWKDHLVQSSFSQLHAMVKGAGYNSRARFGFSDTDFFFEQFILPFMNPSSSENRLITLFDHVVNVDRRDEINDALLALFCSPLMSNACIAAADPEWFSLQCEKIERLLTALKPLVPKRLYERLVNESSELEERIRKVFEQVGIEADITRLPSIVRDVDNAYLDDLYAAYMQFSLQLFDLCALKNILTDPHDLIFIYCGSMHAQWLDDCLYECGALSHFADLTDSDDLVKNSELLSVRLHEFAKDLWFSGSTRKNSTCSPLFINSLMKEFDSLRKATFDASPAYTHQIGGYDKKYADVTFANYAQALGDQQMVAYLERTASIA